MKNLYLLIALCLFSVGYAQNPADRDPSFNQFNLHINNYFFGSSNFTKGKTATLSDGKIFVLDYDGLFVKLNGNLLETNISKDFNGYISDFFVQTDGKIIVKGDITSYKGLACGDIIRLNVDLSIDNTFNLCSGLESNISNCFLQNDGKLIVTGNFVTVSGVSVNSSNIRINTDGSFDTAFSFLKPLEKIIFQPDNKILGIYKFSSNSERLIRLNQDGAIDNTFALEISNGSGYRTNNVGLQSDGKIIISGNFVFGYPSYATEKILRLNSNGTIDSSFDVSGLGFNYQGTQSTTTIYNLLVQPDDKIIVTGIFDKFNNTNYNKITRLNASGTIDLSFDVGNGITDGAGVTIVGLNLSLSNNGKIICTGNFTFYNNETVNKFVRINTDGSRDITFNNICKGFDKSAYNTAIQLDGKILASGIFNSFNGYTVNNIVRLNSDETIDNTFNSGKGFINSTNTGSVRQMFSLPDGKIFLFVDLNNYNGTAIKDIIKLNNDGSIDTSFITGSGFNGSGTVSSTKFDSLGRIIVVGSFTSYNGTPCNRMVRLLPNGSIDTTFNASGLDYTYFYNYMEPFVLADGKILFGKTRLNSDGSIDTGFLYSSSINFEQINQCVQQDGKIIVSTSGFVSSTASSKFAYRLNTDGSLDTSFNAPNIDVDVDFVKIVLQADSKLLVFYRYFSGHSISKIIRLNTDGSLDSNFNMVTGFNGGVCGDMEALSNGTILVSGGFDVFNNLPERYIVRLRGGDNFYFLQGQNRIDNDNNGCDISDFLVPNLKFNISSTTDNWDYVSNTSGNYNIGFFVGNYIIAPSFENQIYFNVSPTSITASFPTQASPLMQNFCITANGTHPDLEVSLLPINAARPGFDGKYKLIYKNKANQVQSGTVALTFNDATLDLVSANPVVSSQAVNSLFWNFTNLNPFETREILVTLNLNSAVETPPINAGNVLNYTANITSAQTDETPNDNTFALNQTVVNSYDPNDKTCLQGLIVGTDKVGDYVHYVIRFENSGTYNAQNITIKDVIDTNKFDINTLIPLSGNALFTTKISQGNKVEFLLENINLPYAAGINTGYVAFKIKTKSTLVAGDTFGGLANIYFDYNSAITTNTYTTTIQALSVQDFSFVNYFSLYPNPVSNVLNINKKSDIEISSIHIYNVLGQLMMVIPNAKNTATIDVSNLTSGNYFVKINSDKGTSNTKFIKN